MYFVHDNDSHLKIAHGWLVLSLAFEDREQGSIQQLEDVSVVGWELYNRGFRGAQQIYRITGEVPRTIICQ
jgi:hypothetical protein